MPDQLRILILEDVAMDAELVEYELAKAQIRFILQRVDTREQFLEGLREFRPDIILSDYSLPGFNGMAALFLTRQEAPHVPFIVVTGSVNEETAVRCMKAGAADYLLKNNLARIGPAIEAALERARARAEKQRAEQALAASERRFRSLVQNSSDVVIVIRPDGTITYASDSAARITGFAPEVLVGTSVFDYLHPDCAPLMRATMTASPDDAAVSGPLEVTARHASGTWITLEVVGTNLLADPVIKGIVFNGRDVSERTRAERALRESEERYRDLFDNASDLIWIVEPDGRFGYVNRAWRDALGYGDDDLATLRLADVVHPDSRDTLAEAIQRVLAGEALEHIETNFVTRDGETITVEGNTSATFKDGEPVSIRGIYRDITERKRMEDHLRRTERMQAAGKLAGGVAHEVNNMMTAVIGFGDFLLRRMEPADTRREDVEEILKAANRAATVTRQLLAFTRQQYLQPRPCDLNAVVTDIWAMLRRSLGEDKELERRLSPNIGRIRADRAQIEQVLINLVLNARDAMAQGGRVTIETAAVELDAAYTRRHPGVDVPVGEYVLLAVSDTGDGMDRETQARIFEPFFTTKPVGQGTGLGLSTVYGIVKQSEGFVWVYSEPGLGTTFKIYFPRTEEPAVQDAEPETSQPAHGTETVLVVEDEETVRHLACRILREYGYTVLEARHGAEARMLVERAEPPVDLVLSDVVMPVMGGRELGEHLALEHPNLPVLYTSGYTGDDVVLRGLLPAGAPFEPKPFAPERLARTIREMLDGRAAARRAAGAA